MKTVILNIALFTGMCIASCADKATSTESIIAGELKQEPVNLLLQQQQERELALAQQRYTDSLNRVKAIADSIEKERQMRLIEENKQRKLSDAYSIISKFSTTFMNRVSPATGKNLDYNILYDESNYDELTGTMIVAFRTNWEAVADFNWNSPYEMHIYKGKIILYENGEIRHEQISQNDVLTRAIKATSAAEEILEWLNKNASN